MKKPIVSGVERGESSSNYHEIAWAKDGDLNAAYRRGHVKRFRFKRTALQFAKKKARQLGVSFDGWR